MATLEQMLAKAAKENQAEEARRSKDVTEDQAREMAKFLCKWSRYKPIRRQDSGSTFWSNGRYMTQLTFGMVNKIVELGLGTLVGDAKDEGARLTMIKVEKPAKKAKEA